MKKIITMLLLLTTIVINAQEINTEDLNKEISEINQKLKTLLENSADTTVAIGYFHLKKMDSVKTYIGKVNKEINGPEIKIKKVIIDIKDNVIFDIQVITTDNFVYTNPSAPIEIYNLNPKRCDFLICKQNNTTFSICQILNYINKNNTGIDDARIVLDKDKKKAFVYKNQGINSVFNIRLYTDLLGVFGRKSNGLVQTDVEFRTNIHNWNIPNANFYVFRNIYTKLSLSKFDSKFSNTNIDSTFSRSTLTERSWLNTEIGISVFSGALFRTKSNTIFKLDFLGGFYLTDIKNKKNTNTIALPYYGVNPSIDVNVFSNLNFNFSAPIRWQFAPQLESKSFSLDRTLISPQVEVAFFPLSSPSNKIFTRIKYNAILGDREPFWQFQLGYNLVLSELIGKKTDQ